VLLKGEIVSPPWFNLAWWGFRTFMTFERDAGDHPEEPPTKG